MSITSKFSFTNYYEIKYIVHASQCIFLHTLPLIRDTYVKIMEGESKNDRNDRGLSFA